MIDNPYWELLRPLAVEPRAGLYTFGGPQIGAPPRPGMTEEQVNAFYDGWILRFPLTNQYSWSVPDEESVLFVAEFSGGTLIDPFAGTGYWCHLLSQLGVDCVASDINPPEPGAQVNIWHKDVSQFFPVTRAAAADAVAASSPSKALLLSWPPADTGAYEALHAYSGDRVIYIGEDAICAEECFFAELEKQWVPIAAHPIVQWSGIHDYIAVFERS